MATKLSETLEILKNLESIPTLPAIVTKIIDVANDKNSTAKDLNSLISKDQALAARTLKLANSAYYGFPRTISKITEAIVVLGFNTVKGIALSASVCHMYKDTNEILGFSPNKLWEHSVGVAICSELIAKKIKFKQIEELFILGIVHDIGILIILEFLKSKLNTILYRTKNEKQRLSNIEKEEIGIDHAVLGKRLAEQWKLPKVMGDVIAFHHTPQYAFGDSKPLASIIYIADIICRLKKIGHDGEYYIPPLSKEAFETIGFDKNDIKEMADKLDLELEKASDFLDLVKK
jgi:HD-like signal output (HDOD) protein